MAPLRLPLALARRLGGSWRDLLLALVPVALLLAAAAWAVLRFVRPAPPSEITISTGPADSSFQRQAERYVKAFQRSGVRVKLRPSNGSLDNLRRLTDPREDADIGFVQVGVKLPEARPGEARRELASLGTVARQPLWLFVRGDRPPDRLAALAGQRVVVGPEGSGTRVLALRLLDANGIRPGGATALLDVDDERVGAALEKGEVDAAFLMGDSASPAVVRALLTRPGVHAVALSQLDAYLRRFQDLDRVVIPMGAFDFAKNIPEADLPVLASSVEVLARADLHPAISDLLLETMREVHGRANLLQHAGDFPAAREHEVPLSRDALRYYASGKRWLYRMLPFWAASLADRFLMVLVPILLLAVPALRLVPALYAWRIRARVTRVYASLLELERAVRDASAAEREVLLARLDALERRADGLKLPAGYADQFYVLREHIGFVRRRLAAAQQDVASRG
jgi:TRAP-type uncharacterized transport system substrate-binding protein